MTIKIYSEVPLGMTPRSQIGKQQRFKDIHYHFLHGKSIYVCQKLARQKRDVCI